MARPKKWRRVAFIPERTLFCPIGEPPGGKEVVLSMEEIEALRLKELEGLDQKGCARRMRVSRATFQRVLGSARGKMAEAVVLGKGIRVEGGSFQPAWQHFRCLDFGHEWDVSFEEAVIGGGRECPDCNSTNVQSLPQRGLLSAGYERT
jgi:predicted DNA-binding protein (UPF0251 family)